ncbi:MAG TPA: dipeptide epimerase [Megamonas hypermegale]|nr:dipeptide epimerase [Megamonas hypermegale]
MKIIKIEIGKVKIPLKKPFITALRHVDFAEDIIIKIITDTGNVGYGNAPPTAVITGDSQDSIISAIQNVIAPQLIGLDIWETEEIFQRIDKSMLHNSSAKACLDIAVYDLLGQMCNLPLYKLLGGYRHSFKSDLTISLREPGIMAQDAREAVNNGYTDLKLKVGGNAKLDFERVKAIREAVGDKISIRLDANQGWKPKEAVRLIRQFEDKGLNIELIEQPVIAHDMSGLKFVTDNVDTLIMADEAAFGTYEVFQLLSNRACDLINIKLMKAGGIHNALKIADMASTCGVECMMGCMLESKLGITASASLAGAKSIITRADLDAADLLAEDPIKGGISYNKNTILSNEQAGLGISEIQNWQFITEIK